MDRFRSKEQIIDYATQLQILYYTTPGSDVQKRTACRQAYTQLSMNLIEALLHPEFVNFCGNIQDYNLYDFVDAIRVFGNCRYNSFEDGYPIDPVSQNPMRNWKNIGVNKGYGYEKETLSQLTRSNFKRDPLTNLSLSVNEIEDRDNAAAMRVDEYHDVYSSGADDVNHNFTSKRLNFDEDIDE